MVLANHHNVRPSEILNIENDWLAYCFDEVCLYYKSECYDEEKYKYNWDKLTFKGDKPKNPNAELMEFINTQNKQGGV